MGATRSQETHHARITEDIRQNIVDGSWAPGHRLARETDMAARYGVSRMTMNKVLTQLSTEGFLVRRKRKGTFVAQPRAQSAVMEIGDIKQEVEALNLDYSWRLITAEIRQLTEDDRRILDLAEPGAPGRALWLQGVHHAGKMPFCLECRIINPEAVAAAPEQDFSRTPPGPWLLETMPWSRASHRIRAVNGGDADAGQLGLQTGAACLEVLRETTINALWVTRVRLLYPGAAHQLIAQFEPQGQETAPDLI